jgi:hypothetical protein
LRIIVQAEIVGEGSNSVKRVLICRFDLKK